ncbi:MAG: hypothetical protein JWR26_4025 [Pedosphaera sp.]|nr:hypothetical protein [Pedosphaera sp.]
MMTTMPKQHLEPNAGRLQRAFSLIEIMVTVALLSVIILGLVAMFDQTRKAFTSGLTQTDYLEAGRTAADMIARELGQMTPSYTNQMNFYVDYAPGTILFAQPLANPADIRTNGLQRFYFLVQNNRQWSAIAYRFDAPGTSAGVGTLYRCYSPTVPAGTLGNATAIFNAFFIPKPFSTSLIITNRIMDGVVDFRIRAFDRDGNLITNSFNGVSGFASPNRDSLNNVTGDYSYRFVSNTVPAYVELELGVLETKTLQQYKGLPTTNPNIGLNFLANHAGQVHIFRQRIPIRSVDPSAYPFPQ